METPTFLAKLEAITIDPVSGKFRKGLARSQPSVLDPLNEGGGMSHIADPAMCDPTESVYPECSPDDSSWETQPPDCC